MTLLGYKLEPRAKPSAAFTFAITLLAIAVALVITGILFALFGVNPFAAYREILEKTLFSFRGFTEVVRRMIPLLLCGVGIALAIKARFWNIGAEGAAFSRRGGGRHGAVRAITTFCDDSRHVFSWLYRRRRVGIFTCHS